MRTLLSSLLRFLGRHLFQFLLFVALLATGHVLLEQARQLKADQVRLDAMRGAADGRARMFSRMAKARAK